MGIEKSKCKTGMLIAIAENVHTGENAEDLARFERDFHKWHTHILVQKITFYHNEIGNHTENEPFVFIESLGVFDNLKNFSRFLNQQIFIAENKFRTKEINVSCDIEYRGDTLEIYVSKDNHKFELNCSFIKFNQEIVEAGAEGMKFEIPKRI